MTSHTQLSLDQRVQRLDRRIVEIELWEKRQTIALDGWTFNGALLAMGRPWPSREAVARFEHPPVEAPADWPLDATRLQIHLGGEGLIGVDSGGRTRKYRLDPNHGSFPVDGRRVAVVVDCVARSPFGAQSRAALLEGRAS